MMSPRVNHLRLVTGPTSEPRLSGDVCRRAGCAESAIALGFCAVCLAAYRRRAGIGGDSRELADTLTDELSAAAPLLFAAVSAATREALRDAAADVLIRGSRGRDLVSAALAELLVERFADDATRAAAAPARRPSTINPQRADIERRVSER
jgi:hypothetical protein